MTELQGDSECGPDNGDVGRLHGGQHGEHHRGRGQPGQRRGRG